MIYFTMHLSLKKQALETINLFQSLFSENARFLSYFYDKLLWHVTP